MEFSVDSIISIATLLIGGGGGAFFTWRWQRARAKAEAKEAEANAESAEVAAVKEMQDVYQQLIADIKTDRDEQKQYIQELKDDRTHLRQDRDDLRKRQDELEEQVRDLQRAVSRNGRMVECMRPFLCAKASKCKDCVPVTISGEEDVNPKPRRKARKGAEA